MVIACEKVKAYYDPKRKTARTSASEKVETFKDLNAAVKYFNSLGVSRDLDNIINVKKPNGFVYRLAVMFNLSDTFDEQIHEQAKAQLYIEA